jgi:hypothetical protein
MVSNRTHVFDTRDNLSIFSFRGYFANSQRELL